MLTPTLGLGIEDSSSLRRLGIICFKRGKKLVTSHLEKCVSMRLLSTVALGSLSIHSSWKF